MNKARSKDNWESGNQNNAGGAANQVFKKEIERSPKEEIARLVLCGEYQQYSPGDAAEWQERQPLCVDVCHDSSCLWTALTGLYTFLIS
jgi:hypothetical protein